jgi:acyl-CoA synthetase (AMP-forming)/AMP-acid ligase II
VDVSFGTIWEGIAARIPDACAVSEPGRDYTYAEFDDRAARLAAALESAGVRAGDTVACYLHNGAAYLETVFAAFKIGAVPVNANYRYTRGELTELLTDADAAAVVFSGVLAPNVTHAAAHLPGLRLLVRVGDAPQENPGPDAPSLDELLAATPPRAHVPRPGSDQLFLYTGGTTGKPKGVIWRLSDLSRSMGVAVYRRLGVDRQPESVADAVDIAVAARADGRSPSTMPVVPLMHATGLFNTMGALLAGGRAITTRPGRLDPEHVWETLAARRADTLLVAGNAVCQPLVDELRRAEEAGSPHDLSSLRYVTSSGTAFSDRLKLALHQRADVTITDAIASSEGGPFALGVTTCVADLPARFFPVAATKVITADDRIAGPGDTGMLGFSGPMPLGYHNDGAKTATTFRVIDGVRYSIPGDLAELEADGAIRFLGRGSVVINTGGEKVYPPEVEHVLLTHPDVTDCVVIGVPDDTWGECVAAVVATNSAGLTGAELRGRVRESLAGYKVPRIVVLVDRLPRTPTGKLELAWARRAASGGSEREPG